MSTGLSISIGNDIVGRSASGGGGAPPTFDYSGATLVYSLRKFFGTTHAVLYIKRSSDSALAYVFFDGATPQDTITLDSYISTSSKTTPDATTLGTWAGSDTCTVRQLIGQTPGGLDTAYELTDSLDSHTFINAGAIVTKNGKPTLNLNGSGTAGLKQATQFAFLDSTETFSVFSVASLDTVGGDGALMYTGRITTDAFEIRVDSSASTVICDAYGSTTSAVVNYSAQQDTTNQKLLSVIKTASYIDSYYNGASQETGVAWSGTYTNDEFYLCRERNAVPNHLIGTFQEMIFFSNDQTANVADINAEMNGYYSIY